MKTSTHLLRFGLCSWGLFFLGGRLGSAADAPKPTQVKIIKPARGEIFRFISIPGVIKANQQVTYYSRVSGYLKTLSIDKGDAVKSGQSLGEIETPELVADEARYKAEVAVAQADFKRVSDAQAKAADLVTVESVDQAKGRLDVARASLERTVTFLRYARIPAPFDGIVTARFVDPGAFIPAAASGSAPQSAALFALADFTVVRAQVNVPEVEAPRIQIGEPVKLTVEGLASKSFEGKVTRFSYTLDEATRTMPIEADLPNKDLLLRPGMYAAMRIGVEKHTDVLLIPVDALVMEKTNAFVYVVDQGRAHRLAVKIGFTDGEKAEVLTGLTGNESVIVVGKLTLTDGQMVSESF